MSGLKNFVVRLLENQHHQFRMMLHRLDNRSTDVNINNSTEGENVLSDYNKPKSQEYKYEPNKQLKCDTCHKETPHGRAGAWWYCLICKRRSLR